jgi:peroxiredoxin
MKKILILAIVALTAFSCKEEKKHTSYVINGTAKGIYNGIRVQLKAIDLKSLRERVIDTAIIMNEKFSFEGELAESPELRSITVDNMKGKFQFVLENENITIEIDKSNIMASKVIGSDTHDTYKDYESELLELRRENLTAIQAQKNAIRRNDETLKDSLTTVVKDLSQKMSLFPIRFIEKHKDSPLSLILIEQEINKGLFTINTFKETFDYLDNDIKTSPKGILLETKINALSKMEKESKELEIGEIAPNFKAPSPNGDIISLDAIKGKVTIIDFWAAWCGPCRRENPNVVKIYNELHDQGLEIIGVSLDGHSGQNNPKALWIDAIEKDNLTWHQVSYLDYFNDPIAQLYNIKAIPATYVLDSEGKIVAKNLRGEALRSKVKELLSK